MEFVGQTATQCPQLMQFSVFTPMPLSSWKENNAEGHILTHFLQRMQVF